MLGSSTAPLPATDRIGRFNVDQYFRMIETGIIKEGAPYELLDGLIVLKDRSKKGEPLMTVGIGHMLVVNLLLQIARKFDGHTCFMQIQGPVVLSSIHAPEPDGAIVRGGPRDYSNRTREAKDVSSVIEVGDSSAQSDRSDKGPKYAEAGIPQFILINLGENVVEIFEVPNTAKRFYESHRVVRLGDTVDFLLPDRVRVNIPVSDLLP